ncbi:hypothetical protein ACROYT_G033805 [Oculina patagonica]
MPKQVKDYLLEMVLTGIIGLLWSKVTYLIVSIMDKDGKNIFNTLYDSSGQHTEMNMLSDKEFLAKVKPDGVSIVITMNYSPCRVCAPKLKEFYKNNKSSIQNLTIRFAHIYTDKKENKILHENGLKNLYKKGITLEAMDDDSWNKLGIDFEELDKDPDWKEEIRKKIWQYQKKLRENLKLEDVVLPSDWKEQIRKAIRERDQQTRCGLKKLLLPDVEELTRRFEADVKVSGNLTVFPRLPQTTSHHEFPSDFNAMAEGGKDFRLILEEMLRTGLYEWPKVTYLVVIIKDKDGSVIFDEYYDSSDHEDHAEIKMLEDEKFQKKVESTLF